MLIFLYLLDAPNSMITFGNPERNQQMQEVLMVDFLRLVEYSDIE